jgi:ComF family protein
MFETLLDLLFPRYSLEGEEGEWVTEKEWKRFSPCPFALYSNSLRNRGMPHVERLCSAMMYNEDPLLRRAIHQWKYNGVRAMDPIFIKLIQSSGSILPQEDRVFCPVPLHWTRRFARGFNQAELLAKALAQSQNGIVSHLLTRTRPTGHQAHRNGVARRQAMDQAFTMRFGSRVPERVTLVDDVCTTGATLEAAAEVLMEAGVKHVEAAVIALD